MPGIDLTHTSTLLIVDAYRTDLRTLVEKLFLDRDIPDAVAATRSTLVRAGTLESSKEVPFIIRSVCYDTPGNDGRN